MNWTIICNADFYGDYQYGDTTGRYGDFRSQYLAQNSLTGDIALWLGNSSDAYLLNGGAFSSLAPLDWIINPGADWKIVGIGDFDLDGHSDILFQNSASGDLYLWYTNLYLRLPAVEDDYKVTVTRTAPISPSNPGPNWKAVLIADVDQDGQPDILFQNSLTGYLYVWYMNGNKLRFGEFLTPFDPGAGWRLVGTADLNKDGSPDLIFQNEQTGMLAYWLMYGSREYEIGLFNPPGSGGPDERLVGPK